MQVKATYRPGQKGTQKLTRKYGDKLVCVRYRYDAFQQKRYKTIEIIIDESHWSPPPPHPHEEERLVKTHTDFIHRNFNEKAAIKIGWHEKELQQRVKAIGGTWSPEEKLWYADKQAIIRANLQDRIV